MLWAERRKGSRMAANFDDLKSKLSAEFDQVAVFDSTVGEPVQGESVLVLILCNVPMVITMPLITLSHPLPKTIRFSDRSRAAAETVPPTTLLSWGAGCHPRASKSTYSRPFTCPGSLPLDRFFPRLRPSSSLAIAVHPANMDAVHRSRVGWCLLPD